MSNKFLTMLTCSRVIHAVLKHIVYFWIIKSLVDRSTCILDSNNPITLNNAVKHQRFTSLYVSLLNWWFTEDWLYLLRYARYHRSVFRGLKHGKRGKKNVDLKCVWVSHKPRYLNIKVVLKALSHMMVLSSISIICRVWPLNLLV